MFECTVCVWLPLRLPCATSTSQPWLLNHWRGEVSTRTLLLWLLFAAWFSVFVPMRKYLCISSALIFLLWCVHHCKHGNLQPEHPITAFVYLFANLSFWLTRPFQLSVPHIIRGVGWYVCVPENEQPECFCVGCVLVWGRFFENSQRMKLSSTDLSLHPNPFQIHNFWLK